MQKITNLHSTTKPSKYLHNLVVFQCVVVMQNFPIKGQQNAVDMNFLLQLITSCLRGEVYKSCLAP